MSYPIKVLYPKHEGAAGGASNHTVHLHSPLRRFRRLSPFKFLSRPFLFDELPALLLGLSLEGAILVNSPG